MRSRIDGLIAEQVGNGTLTSDQASELKNLRPSIRLLIAAGSRREPAAPAVSDVEAAGAPPEA
jgi:hypothetical protein